MANTKKYLTEEERKKVQKEYNRNYYLKNKEKLLPKQKEYNQSCTKCNRERGTKSFDEFYTMKMGEVS